MQNNVLLRRAKISDAKSIAMLLIETRRECLFGVLPHFYLNTMSLEKKTADWEANLSHSVKGQYTWVAECENKLVGVVSGGTPQESFSYPIELQELYVKKDFQKSGVGRALFELFSKEVKSSFYLAVLSKNPSKAFYQKMGGKLVFEGIRTIGDENCDISYFEFLNHSSIKSFTLQSNTSAQRTNVENLGS